MSARYEFFLTCVAFAFVMLPIEVITSEDVVERNTTKWTMPMWLEEVPVMYEGSVFTYKSLYVGEIYFGTPGKKYTLIFDTGSGNTVLPQMGCQSVGCIGKSTYDSRNSSTSSRVTDDESLRRFRSGRIMIKYGDGDVSGSFARDLACLGPNSEQCVKFNFVQARLMSTNPFALFSFDGVLGLGLSSLSASSNFSFVQQMLNQYPGAVAQLSIFLASDGRDNAIMLGGYDETRALEEPKWAPVFRAESGYWQVAMKSFAVAGVPLDYCDDGECRAVTDLGSTLFNVPTPIIGHVRESLLRFVPRELYTDGDDFDCLSFVTDGVSLDLGEFSITLPPSEVMSAKAFKRTAENGTEHLVCPAKIHHIDFPPPVGPKVFILGHPMLRTYYTVYDWDEKRIGFALANQTVKKEYTAPRRSTPIYIRTLGSLDYYLPHLTGKEEEMEEYLATFESDPSNATSNATNDTVEVTTDDTEADATV